MLKYKKSPLYRWGLALCLVCLGSCAWLAGYSNSPESVNGLPVATTSGLVQGRTVLSKGVQIFSWYDIPYAQPPFGKLRWRAPRALIAPDQIIKDIENNACVQPASDYAGIKGQGVVGTEDCLYLE